MEPQTEGGRFLSDHRLLPISVYQRIGMSFVALCFIVGVAYVGYIYYAGPIIAEKQSIEASDKLIAEMIAQASPFTFSIVPNALEIFTIPEPVTPSIDELKAEFTTARDTLPRNSDTEIQKIYDLPVGEITFLDYVNGIPREMQDPFIQMQDEIDQLVVHLNQKYEQKTLASRIGEPDALLYPEASKFKGMTSVYPSQRVAEAYFIGKALAIQFPSQADFLMDFVNEYINMGVAYGHYSKLDVAITEMLVADYITAASETEQGKLVLQSLE